PHCGVAERLIDVAPRMGRPPAWRLFALEVLGAEQGRSGRAVPLARRAFRAATDADRTLVMQAEEALRARTAADGTIRGIPERAIPRDGRADDRLIRYGYRSYRELFNPRQLLHLSL